MSRENRSSHPDSQRCDHRHHAVFQQQFNERNIDRRDSPHQSQINSAVADFFSAQKHIIDPAEADGIAVVAVDKIDNLFIDFAGQHHLDNLHHRFVGIALPVHEFRFDAQFLCNFRDLFSTAVDNHNVDPDLAEYRHILPKRLSEQRVVIAAPPYFITNVFPSYFWM